MSDQILNEVFNGFLASPNEFHGYAMIIDNRLFCDSKGSYIFETPTQATKSLYNKIRWRIRLCKNYHTDGNYQRWYNNHGFTTTPLSDEDSFLLSDWKEFKKDLVKNHGLRIIKI